MGVVVSANLGYPAPVLDGNFANAHISEYY
jgi:hypothetical protein